MKITYLYQYFGTPKGSWSTRVYELTRRWAKTGVDVTVITAPYDKSDVEPQGFVSEQIIEGVKIIVINFSSISSGKSSVKSLVGTTKFNPSGLFHTLK